MKSSLTHFILILMLGIVTTVSYVFWYIEVSEKSAKVAGLESQIAEAADEMNRISSSRAMLAEIAGDEAKMRNYFVSETGIVSFINDLESRGTSEKATVKVVSVSTGGNSAQPQLLLAVSIRGDFDAVLTTIGLIEYAPYALSIPTLSLAQDGKNSWNANMNLIVGSAPVKI